MPESNAKVTGDFSNLIKGADDAAKSLVNLAAKVVSLASPVNIASKAVGGMIDGLGKLGLAAMGVEAIGKSAAGMAQGLLKGNAALEMTTISFKTLLGSAAAADAMIKQLTAFAAATPFELTGLEANTQKLLAFGFQAQDIIPLMTSLGDAIAALGGTQDNLNSLVYVMGQMRQEAHINAGDIMQMVNQGIPALQMLADHYHVTTSEIQQMISKGLIPGKEAVDIFTKGLEDKYGGMMAAQSSTFSGMMSNLQDWATQTTNTLTKPFFEPAKKALKAFLDYVQSPTGVAAINKLAAMIQSGVDQMTVAFEKLQPHIKPIFENLLKVAEALRAQMTPGIVTIIPLLIKFWSSIEPVVLSIWKFYQAIQPLNIAFAVFKGYLQGGMIGALDALKERFGLIAGYVKVAFDAALVEVKKWGGYVLVYITDMAITIANKIVTWGESFISWVAPYAVKLVNALIDLSGRITVWVVGYTPVLAQQLLKWTDKLAGWIIPAIPLIVKNLEIVGQTVINWGITRLPQIMVSIVNGIGDGLGVNFRGVVSDVLKIFNSLVLNIRSTVLPAFIEMVKYLSNNFLPILDRVTRFTAQTVIPTISSLAAFVMTVLVPAFVNAVDLLGRLFGPALTLIGSIIRNELLPALSDSWTYFDGKYMPTVRDLASALGDKLAEGIRIATDKFELAIPKLDGFYKKIEPIVGKAIDLYKAISPISIALDVLKGFLTGGLQGGFGALEQHVVDLGKVFGFDLQPVIDWFNETVVKQVIPTVKEWARVFIDDWWPKIRDAVLFVWKQLGDFWTFFSTKIWPPVSEILGWLGDRFSDMGKAIEKTWNTIILPAVQEFVRWFEKELWPTLRDDVFPWIVENVPKFFNDAFKVLNEKIIPWIGDLISIVLKIIPVLVSWWGVLFLALNPFLKTAGDLIKDITDGLQGQKDPLGKAVDGFKGLADTMKIVFDVLGKVAGGFHTLWYLMGGWILEPVFKSIGNIIGLIGGVGEMLDALEKHDFMGMVNAANKIAAFFKPAQQIISGNGLPPPSAGQAALDQYMKDHPEYDPVAAGNAPKKGTGDLNWRGGLVTVGDAGAELIKTLAGQIMLATQPTTTYLPPGTQIFNAQQTSAMFSKMPATGQQITNMYHNANSGGNSYATNNFNLGVHTNQSPGVVQQSFGMMKVMYGKS